MRSHAVLGLKAAPEIIRLLDELLLHGPNLSKAPRGGTTAGVGLFALFAGTQQTVRLSQMVARASRLCAPSLVHSKPFLCCNQCTFYSRPHTPAGAAQVAYTPGGLDTQTARVQLRSQPLTVPRASTPSRLAVQKPPKVRRALLSQVGLQTLETPHLILAESAPQVRKAINARAAQRSFCREGGKACMPYVLHLCPLHLVQMHILRMLLSAVFIVELLFCTAKRTQFSRCFIIFSLLCSTAKCMRRAHARGQPLRDTPASSPRCEGWPITFFAAPPTHVERRQLPSVSACWVLAF